MKDQQMTIVPITSSGLEAAEVSWYAPICSCDYAYLGVPDDELRSSWENGSRIVKRAESYGFRNILCPSSYDVGQDTLTFVAACAPLTDIRDPEACLAIARAYSVDAVTCLATEAGVVSTAHVAAVMGLPGLPVEAAYKVTDKLAMRQAFEAAGSGAIIEAGPDARAPAGSATRPAAPPC